MRTENPGARIQNPEVREIGAEHIAEEVAAHIASGHRLLTVVGSDDRASRADFGLWVALLGPDSRTIQLRAALDPANPRYPALTRLVPAAHWDERELADMLGFVPEGHP